MMRLLLNVSPAKLMPTLWRTMWTKYDYVCSDCDALMEITTRIKLKSWRGWCSCGSANLVWIGSCDATRYEEPVTNITSSKVVKINSNPYN